MKKEERLFFLLDSSGKHGVQQLVFFSTSDKKTSFLEVGIIIKRNKIED